MSIDLDAIQARRKEHGPCTAEVCGSRVCQTARDRDALLAYARDLEARIGRVEALADSWLEDYGPGSRAAEILGPQKVSIKFAVGEIRAALTATEGPA